MQRGKSISSILRVSIKPRRLGFTSRCRPRESGNILEHDHKSSGVTERTKTRPDIGDRALHNTGLRSAVTRKGKHRGPHLLYVTLFRPCPARGHVHSLAMRCPCCCLAGGMSPLCECDLGETTWRVRPPDPSDKAKRRFFRAEVAHFVSAKASMGEASSTCLDVHVSW